MMRNFLDILLLFTAATYTNDRYASNINGNGNDCPIWPQEFRTDIKITGGPNSSADLLHSFIRGTFFYDSLNQQAATYLIYPPSIEAGEGGGDWQFRRQVLKYGRVYDIDLATGDCKSYPSNTHLDPKWLQKAFWFAGEEYLQSPADGEDVYARVLFWKHWLEGDLPWNPRRQLVYYHRPVSGKRMPTCPDNGGHKASSNSSSSSSSSSSSGEGFRIMVRQEPILAKSSSGNNLPLLIEFSCWTVGLEGVDKDFIFEVPYFC